MKITTLSIDGTPQGGGELSILYQPPLMSMFYDGTPAGTAQAQIVIQSTLSSRTKTITVNAVGNVEAN